MPVTWDELPGEVRQAVEQHTGPVLEAEPCGEGLNAPVKLRLTMARSMVFAKGAGPDDPEHRHRKLTLGAAITPYVHTIAPALLWRVSTAGWDITGYEFITGRPWAVQKPGSPDIPLLLDVLRTLENIPAPCALTTTAAECWDGYLNDRSVLAGNSLVHRDPNPCNFVISQDRAWMTDWGWAVRGPAWLTAAQLVLSMIESGWEPGAAESAVSALPSWQAAEPGALAAFAEANVRMWEEAVSERGGRVLEFRAGIARQWAGHRMARV